MSALPIKKFQPPPVGMTIIKDQQLVEIKALYHEAIGRIVTPESEDLLLFTHFGNFNPSKIESAIKLTESLILEIGDKRQTMKRFCSLFIEILQNISLHAARDRNDQMHAFVVISRGKNSYRLVAGNLVLNVDTQALVQRIDELNEMDATALRRLYIETLCNDEFSAKGGAGLGLLTVAKKIDGKINYDIIPVDSSFNYFRMEVEMSVL
ncbi:MAG TPA: SiaB family protein kinase [Flavobacteriales bacterium]